MVTWCKMLSRVNPAEKERTDNVTGPLMQHKLLGVLGLRTYFYYSDVAVAILKIELIELT